MTDGRNATAIADLIAKKQLVINDGYGAKNSELGDKGLPFARAGNINAGFWFEDAAHKLDSHGTLRARHSSGVRSNRIHRYDSAVY